MSDALRRVAFTAHAPLTRQLSPRLFLTLLLTPGSFAGASAPDLSDAFVVGAGIVGLSAALELSGAGARRAGDLP